MGQGADLNWTARALVFTRHAGAANFGGLLHVFFDIEIDYKKAGRLTMVHLPISQSTAELWKDRNCTSPWCQKPSRFAQPTHFQLLTAVPAELQSTLHG